MTLASATVLLFLVIDPFGNVPFFVSALKQVDPARRRRVVVRELLIAYAVMVVFLFFGQPLLKVLGISGPALTIAGGVILFLIALRMVFPMRGRSSQEDIEGEPFIVPLAIPYVAGPSVLAVELLLMSDEPTRWPVWLVAISIAWAVTAVIVLFGSQVAERLGSRGLIAVERLMGMILVAIAIQMFLTGADMYFGRG
ncbi:MAG: NAAT family transporter [Gammaproteobacteria bacterium]|nr:NAAT family transporter [Gammaproteobacteria bacterium]MDH3578926.1 NAAT family transporter [Gammaproteobacteria bacterium]